MKARSMDTVVYSLESRDFLEMEAALSAWDHRYRQISPGAFRGNLLHTQVGSLGIFRNCWERAIHYRGVAPEGTIALGVTLAQNGEGRWMGQRMGPDDMIVSDCHAEGEFHSAPFWDSVVFAIPETELVQQIADITHDDPRNILIKGLVHLTPQVSARVRRASMTYLDAAAQSLLAPDVLSPLPQMAKSIIELIARALISAQPHRHSKLSLNRQRQLIHKAEDYCVHHSNSPLIISQLCREIDVSERTLRYAFHNKVGTSPLAYLKVQLLNQVYRVMRDADPGTVIIKQIAIDHGFTHLGHFSGDYQRLFGELPSETLHR